MEPEEEEEREHEEQNEHGHEYRARIPTYLPAYLPAHAQSGLDASKYVTWTILILSYYNFLPSRSTRSTGFSTTTTTITAPARALSTNTAPACTRRRTHVCAFGPAAAVFSEGRACGGWSFPVLLGAIWALEFIVLLDCNIGMQLETLLFLGDRFLVVAVLCEEYGYGIRGGEDIEV